MRTEETEFRNAWFAKNGGPLTKAISLGPDGSLISDGSGCRMTDGWAVNASFTGLAGFAEMLEEMDGTMALALGVLRDLPDGQCIRVVANSRLSQFPGAITRSKENLPFPTGQPSLLLMDHDRDNIPDRISDRMAEAGGFRQMICEVFPFFSDVGYVRRTSTSGGLRNTLTGEEYPGSGGEHVYFAVKDGSDIPRAIRVIHQRLWLAGLGWIKIGSVGQLLERSIIDQSVGSPERLVFEGPPIIAAPLEQPIEARRPEVAEGVVLDTRAQC